MRVIIGSMLSCLVLGLIALSAQAEAYDYSIAGSSSWTKTPYNAVQGKELVIAATGEVKHSWMSGWHGPGGNSSAFCADCRVTRKCNVAALIMRIGERGDPYCVDPFLSGAAPASGAIYFSINDFPLNDNEGSFDIKLEGPGVSLGGSTFD